MRNQRILIVVIGVALLVIAALIVISVAKNWADWIVFGVIVLTFFGAAIAIYPRRYTAKKRTFVKTTKPPE